MINKKKTIVLIGIAAAVVIAVAVVIMKKNGKTAKVAQVVKPSFGSMQTAVSATGTVLPYNRLEIKPQINGRMESVLVSEGQKVRKGQIMGWMSSTERAALIDAARAQGTGSLKYWEETYKPIPVVAPINGTVIVRAIEPGQAVLNSAAILVLSDRLIVKADVDETDIGRVKEGQRVSIKLDAYPDVVVSGRVDLVEYESKIINNVTMYVVNIVPDMVPAVYRSGMSANVDIIDKKKDNALLLPLAAVSAENGKNYVLFLANPKARPVKRAVTIGMTDDQNVEILSGIDEKSLVAIMAQDSLKLDAKQSSNPFMPQRKKMMK